MVEPKLVIYPNEVLLQTCEAVDFNNIDPSKYKKAMIDIMANNNGLGLAAPQVGLNYRFFMMETDMFINPVILEESENFVIDIEGCLSFPHMAMKVKRAKNVIVEYTDTNGKRKEGKYEGYMARCFQHELDHLNGITFDKRVSRLVFDRALQQRKKQHGR